MKYNNLREVIEVFMDSCNKWKVVAANHGDGRNGLEEERVPFRAEITDANEISVGYCFYMPAETEFEYVNLIDQSRYSQKICSKE